MEYAYIAVTSESHISKYPKPDATWQKPIDRPKSLVPVLAEERHKQASSDFGELLERWQPWQGLLLVCQEGLRSTAAADKLEQVGFENIACITSGLQSVKPGAFDTVGSTELKDAGKAGLVTVQGKISSVLGTVLICAYLFITFFPDQAEKILAIFPTT